MKIRVFFINLLNFILKSLINYVYLFNYIFNIVSIISAFIITNYHVAFENSAVLGFSIKEKELSSIRKIRNKNVFFSFVAR